MRGVRGAGPADLESGERVAELEHAPPAHCKRIVEEGEGDEVGARGQLADLAGDGGGAAVAEAAAGDVVAAEGAGGRAPARGEQAGGRDGLRRSVPARVEEIERLQRRGERVEIEEEAAGRDQPSLECERAHRIKVAAAVERVAQLCQRLFSLAGNREREALRERLQALPRTP